MSEEEQNFLKQLYFLIESNYPQISFSEGQVGSIVFVDLMKNEKSKLRPFLTKLQMVPNTHYHGIENIAFISMREMNTLGMSVIVACPPGQEEVKNRFGNQAWFHRLKPLSDLL